MIVADYIVKYLKDCGVQDIFGIPGGVILPLLYAIENGGPDITPHLNYHEQMAGFAACGYAHAGRRLGVAYATRGPGITNMLTCIVEAWQESLPVLFITAHGNRGDKKSMRCEFDQEVDLVQSVSSFTKYAVNIERVDDVPEQLQIACQTAMYGRKGPAFLDFSAKVLKEEIFLQNEKNYVNTISVDCHKSYEVIQIMRDELLRANRPVILIGDGIRQGDCTKEIKNWLGTLKVPVLSSRGAQDAVCGLKNYYGYIGSHGLRYSNFILSKTDLIIAVGNRLSFPVFSKSFSKIMENSKIIRLEIDTTEFQREIPNAINLFVDIKKLASELSKYDYSTIEKSEWLNICHKLKKELNEYDMTEPVERIAEYLKCQTSEVTYVCDVGNNEFWFSRAFEYVRPTAQILYSKSFGTLGSAIGKAIGAYYATMQRIICVIGDQGFQYNIQELQYIAYWNLPITILLLNNMSSGMIYDQEDRNYGKLLHVSEATGYTVPDFRKVCDAYGIYYVHNATINTLEEVSLRHNNRPFVYEISFERIQLEPNLPPGNPCQQMTPLLEEKLYYKLNNL